VHNAEQEAEPRIQCRNQSNDDPEEAAVWRGTRYRAPDVPPETATNVRSYLEIAESSSVTDEESSSESDHYDKPDNPYEGLDRATVTSPPPPPVYDHLAH